MAVLPLVYIGDENSSKMENMPFRLQEMTIDYLSRESAELKFMDPIEVNAILLKAGIDEIKIREYTPKELTELLHVEYIIMGSVMQDRGNIVTVRNERNYDKKDIDRNRDDTRIRQRNESHSSTISNQQIENHVFLSIYNNGGDKIYSKSRQSLLSTIDGYKFTLQYLLKRTPLYQR